MRDQLIGIYVIPSIVQILLPMALFVWYAFGFKRSHLSWLIETFSVAAYLVSIALAGLWLLLPWYTVVFYVAIFTTVGFSRLVRIRRRIHSSRRRRSWVSITARVTIAICSVALIFLALRGRRPPAEDFADLEFPLQRGTYYVVAGGNNELINPHLATLTSERFRDYRGQSYGVDIVEVNGLGMRARGIAPRDLRKYIIFGKPVYAPCSGTVRSAADGFPDMPPLSPDRSHMTGNYVFLDCDGRHVLLGHLQQGSVRVKPGNSVVAGTVLGHVGNSGNTGEPHLHIHAQRPAKSAAFMNGDPLPIRFNGRFLVRNDWVRE